jgi:hypothetical protein
VTATFTPDPPTSTFTPVVVTAIFTPELPTATASNTPRPPTATPKPPQPKVTVDKSKSKYNGLVTATLTGFKPNTVVKLMWPGAGEMGRTSVDTTGAGRTQFRTPLVAYGDYQLTASGSGRSATVSFRVIPRIMFQPDDSGSVGDRIKIALYGFAPGEQVEIRWYQADGVSWDPVGVITIADTGRGAKIIDVPASTPGGRKVVAKVIGVKRSVSATYIVTNASSSSAEDPTLTPSTTATSAPTSTAIPTSTPTETPVATNTLTPEPTATETPAPTDTPAPEPTATEIPTLTDVPSPVDPATPEAPADASGWHHSHRLAA